MVTVDEIRARVEAADKARIAKRADAAARVAEGVRRRAELAAALAEQDAVLTSALTDARAVMTDDELVEFTGLSLAELPAPVAKTVRRGGRTARKGSTGKARSTSRPGAKPATAPATAPAAEVVPEPVAVGA